MIITITLIVFYLVLTIFAFKETREMGVFHFTDYHTLFMKIRKIVGVSLFGWLLVIIQFVILLLSFIVMIIDGIFDLEII